VPCRISVFSGRKCEKAPREKPPNGDFFVFSHGDVSPRHTKVRDIGALRFRLLFVVTLPGGVKGRHAKTRKITIWRGFAFTPRKHAYTTWHKSATIEGR